MNGMSLRAFVEEGWQTRCVLLRRKSELFQYVVNRGVEVVAEDDCGDAGFGVFGLVVGGEVSVEEDADALGCRGFACRFVVEECDVLQFRSFGVVGDEVELLAASYLMAGSEQLVGIGQFFGIYVFPDQDTLLLGFHIAVEDKPVIGRE